MAAEENARPDIEELLKVSRGEKANQQVLVDVKQMMEKALGQLGGASDSASMRDDAREKIEALLNSELNWDRVKGEYGRIYAEVFTPEEIQGLIAFYKSPAGQALLDKQPALLRELIELVQNKTTKMTKEMLAATPSTKAEGGGKNAEASPGNAGSAGSPAAGSERPDIEELLVVSRTRESYEDLLKQMMARAEQGQATTSGTTGKREEAIRNYQGIVQSEMSWEKMHREYTRIFSDVYTPDEVRGIIAFYKSPAGKALLDKQKLLNQKNAEIMMKVSADLMPKIEAAMEEEEKGAYSAFGDTGGRVSPTAALSGTYVLAERETKAGAAMDRIAFKPDWTCVFDADDRKGVVGKYQLSQKGNVTSLTIETGTGSPLFTYDLTRLNLSVWLTPSGNGDDLVYTLLPRERPKLKFADIVGIYLYRNDNGDSVTEVTADHRFRVRTRQLDAQDHTYVDSSMDGTCTYSDGVVTYLVEHCTGNLKDKYERDVIVKRDDNGLWAVDPYSNTVGCETPAKSLDLPPPLEGYKAAAQ